MTEVKVPSPGESISQVSIAKWLVSDNDFVRQDDEICEIESEKATLTISSPVTGNIKIINKEGETVNVGSVIATIENVKTEDKTIDIATKAKVAEHSISRKVSPLANKLIVENNIDIKKLVVKGRISRQDIRDYLQVIDNKQADVEIIKMSSLRKKIAERLVSVRNQTAMLTTFNEIDMGKLIELRNKHKEEFFEKHKVKLGFISFFAKAVCLAIKEFPIINAAIDQDNILIHKKVNLSIAVSTDKGLMTPVVKDAGDKSIEEIEIAIAELAQKARNNKISIEELSGGTFTITNGGVFGSLFSTPIINPPQSAILGLHRINDRAVVIDKKIEIRPMMYVALSYDHRLIDGKESVGFIMKVKELIENEEWV